MAVGQASREPARRAASSGPGTGRTSPRPPRSHQGERDQQGRPRRSPVKITTIVATSDHGGHEPLRRSGAPPRDHVPEPTTAMMTQIAATIGRQTSSATTRGRRHQRREQPEEREQRGEPPPQARTAQSPPEHAGPFPHPTGTIPDLHAGARHRTAMRQGSGPSTAPGSAEGAAPVRPACGASFASARPTPPTARPIPAAADHVERVVHPEVDARPGDQERVRDRDDARGLREERHQGGDHRDRHRRVARREARAVRRALSEHRFREGFVGPWPFDDELRRVRHDPGGETGGSTRDERRR